MSVSRSMNELEIRVLNMIINCATFDLPIQASEIRIETGLSKRRLEEVIESLRVNFGHPIVAKKMKPNGYYLPRSEEERQAGLAPYRRQILTEQKNLAVVMNVDLEKYCFIVNYSFFWSVSAGEFLGEFVDQWSALGTGE